MIDIEKITNEIIEAMENSNYKPTDQEIKKLLGYDYKNKKEVKICKKKIRKSKQK